MDRSIRAKFPDDEHVLEALPRQPPLEILDVVVQNLEWFQTTFAMAGRRAYEVVERVQNARGARGG